MKRSLPWFALSLLALLLLTPSAARAAVPDFLIADSEADAGGGCVLPNLEGLSAAEQESALRGSGFELDFEPKAVRVACPATFACNSITNCAAGTNCTVVPLGTSCCTTGPGAAICCANGQQIKVKTCRCRCAANPCSTQCTNSTNVSLQC